MKLLIIVFILPFTLYSQSFQYFTLQAEIDARNALVGGTVNDVGYDVVLKGGFSAQWFRADFFYEFFPDLNYKTGGVNLTYLHNYNRKFIQGAGVQMSLIDKPRKLTPSVGLNLLLEYHFHRFFITARMERKVRTDWDIIVNSGFVGVGVKI